MNDELISRQAAINEANAWLLECLKVQKQDRSCGLIRRLEDLPAAEPKTGYWVPLDERFASWSSYYKCSECGFRINLRIVTDFGEASVDYCPHCMAKMEVKNG